MKFVSIMFLLVGLSACASIERDRDHIHSLVGQNIKVALNAFGEPTLHKPTGFGSEYYEWQVSANYIVNVPSQDYTYGQVGGTQFSATTLTSHPQSVSSSCGIRVFFNPNDRIITRTDVWGSNCSHYAARLD